MTVPDSFGAWEKELGLEINRMVDRHQSIRDQIAKLQKRSEQEELTHEEEMQLFWLQEHSSDAQLDVFELFETDSKVERARGVE